MVDITHISKASINAGTNLAVDGISMDEGWLPSVVNNNVRAGWAILSGWYDDLGGVNTVGGTANAITITSTVPADALAKGMRLMFYAAADNSGPTTLNLDAIGAKTLRKIVGGVDVVLAAGDIQAERHYDISYNPAAAGSSGAWILKDAPAAFAASALPYANDGAALGSATLAWSDLFLAAGAVINADNGDITVTFNTVSDRLEVNKDVVPSVNNGAALGSATLAWSDLFLAAGGVINADNGDITITLDTVGNVVEFNRAITPDVNDGASLGIAAVGWSDLHLATGGTINVANGAQTITFDESFGAGEMIFDGAGAYQFNGQVRAEGDGDTGGFRWGNDSTAIARMVYDYTTHVLEVESHQIGPNGGILLDAAGWVDLSGSTGVRVSGSGSPLVPSTNDGNALGTTALGWSDLHLAAGGTINALNGDVVMTFNTTDNRIELNQALVPSTNDVGALGSATLGWSDLFLAAGGVINAANGDVTITLNTASDRVEFNKVIVPSANDGAALGTTSLGWSDLHLAAGGVINAFNGDVTLTFNTTNNRIEANQPLVPATNDGAALGTTALGWSDLHLAAGGTINAANSALTITFDTVDDVLEFTGAQFYTFDQSIRMLNSSHGFLFGDGITESAGITYDHTANAITIGSQDTGGDIILVATDDITLGGADIDLNATNGVALTGTPTNNNAAAGDVGEYVSSEILVGSVVALTTATPTNITSISLTAGDWDVMGTVALSNVGTTITLVQGAINTTSAALGTVPNAGARMVWNGSVTAGTFAQSVGERRLSLSATTTVYLVTAATFTGGTSCSGYGFLGARRAR